MRMAHNRHSARFLARKVLRRLRDSLDTAIDSLIEDRSRTTIARI